MGHGSDLDRRGEVGGLGGREDGGRIDDEGGHRIG